MKTQLQKPSAGKTNYSTEYKQEALEHWKNSGRSAARVAAELGIRAPLLYRWAKQLRGAAPPGGQPGRAGPRGEERPAEIGGRGAGDAKLLEQREVLKKSLGILSEAPPRGMPKLKP